jgi:hypothetical protein
VVHQPRPFPTPYFFAALVIIIAAGVVVYIVIDFLPISEELHDLLSAFNLAVVVASAVHTFVNWIWRNKENRERSALWVSGLAFLLVLSASTTMRYSLGPPEDLVSFDPPKQMQEGEIIIVEAIVAKRITREEIERRLSVDRSQVPNNQPDREADTSNIKILPVLTATLNGVGFKKEPSVAVTKDFERLVKWKWQIQAEKIGQTLVPGTSDLRILTLEIEGQKNTKAPRKSLFSKSYRVLVTPKLESTYTSIKSWLKDLAWLWVTLLVPCAAGVVWIWRRIRGRPQDPLPE